MSFGQRKTQFNMLLSLLGTLLEQNLMASSGILMDSLSNITAFLDNFTASSRNLRVTSGISGCLMEQSQGHFKQ
jgi:hypothetical protein